MARGRKPYSIVRQRIADILFLMKQSHGHEIYKIYVNVFPRVTRRLIYYHLRKGLSLGEFKVSKIEKQTGNYSWGDTAEKVYYALDESAKPKLNLGVKKYLEKKGN